VTTYKSDDLIRIARRRNNNKRRYLVINPLQGKHLPVRPQDALRMMTALGNKVRDAYLGEKVLCIGFAETATAIGTVVARYLGTDYIHTTRENRSTNYFVFSEAHSHAVEQKLYSDNWEALIDSKDRIVFIEDEISTGKTIVAIATLLREKGLVPAHMRFSAASLLNFMDETDHNLFSSVGIETVELVKTANTGFDATAELTEDSASLIHDMRQVSRDDKDVAVLSFGSNLDPRQGIDSNRYVQACNTLAAALSDRLSISQLKDQRILVLGTEECMYPAMCIAAYFEARNPRVRAYTHATTRTPIVAATSQDYAVTAGFALRSVYDETRPTFLYNLDRYDLVIVITDSTLTDEALSHPLGDIRAAIEHCRAGEGCGSGNFFAVQWTP
jgi:adenine/guanine phosphoribosyltransferase-like PRPP-binding protein